MSKTQQDLYELALSKMAIPTCECLLDDSDKSSFNSPDNNKKDNLNDTTRTSRTRNILAQTQN